MHVNELIPTRRLLLTIGAGFALALLLMAGVSVVGLRELSAADSRLKSIVTENSIKSQLAGEMRDLLRAREIAMLSIVVMNDAFEKDREMLYFYSLGEAYQKTRGRLGELPASGEEQEALARIDALIVESQPLMRETVDLGMEGYTFMAFDLLQRQGISLQRRLVIELDRLVNIQQEAIRAASRQAEEDYRETRWLMVILGTASALLVLVGASLVLRRTRQISAASERERTRFQTLFETNTDAIAIHDRRGFVQCNQATLRMFGLPRQESFLTLRPEELLVGPETGADSTISAMRGFIAEAYGRGHASGEWRCRRHDGGEFPAHIDLYLMTLDGQPHLQFIIRDISAQKRAEQALKAAHAEAIAAADMKSQFVANVSHEIRTPMNGILGMTQLLMDSELSPRQREYAEAVANSGKALMRIINDLLDFSKIEAGRLTLEEIPFNLPQTLHEIMAFYRPRADDKGLAFRLDLPETLPEGVLGDPLRLRQVLLNLLDNAIKFTEKGEVSLAVTPPTAEDGRFHFRVRDSGIGIPATAIERIFSAFSQADGSISRQFGGTGLGLAICKQLAELMRGGIHATSQPGLGSEFDLAIPLPEAPRPATDTAGAEGPPKHFRPAHVLVAEDNPVNQKLTRFMLEDMGLRVTVVGDGKQAYDHLAEADDIDLVLMDCQMPVWDGLAAARAIREHEQSSGRRRLPIVALTANAMKGFQHVCREAGMDAYLSKPLDEIRLATCLSGWLPEQSTDEAATETRPADDAGIDLDKIRHLCRNDAARIGEMLSLFLSSTTELIESLRHSLAGGRLEETARLAHQIKGAAAYMGATTFTGHVSDLEREARSGDQTGAEAAAREIEADFIRLRERVESILHTNHAADGSGS